MSTTDTDAGEIARGIVDQAVYDCIIPDAITDVLVAVCERHIAAALIAAERRGMERAAEWHDERKEHWSRLGCTSLSVERASMHNASAAAIRALAQGGGQ